MTPQVQGLMAVIVLFRKTCKKKGHDLTPRTISPSAEGHHNENGVESFHPSKNIQKSGAGENTLRRLALFVYLDHPTKNDVTSGKKVS